LFVLGLAEKTYAIDFIVEKLYAKRAGALNTYFRKRRTPRRVKRTLGQNTTEFCEKGFCETVEELKEET